MAKISFMEPISDEDFANLTEEGELEAATSLKMAANSRMALPIQVILSPARQALQPSRSIKKQIF